jgi:MFS family permease
MMRVRGDRFAHEGDAHLWADVKEGISYVRSTRWLLWGMLGGMVSLFCVWGPWETLVPFVVADQLRGTELQLALVFGAGGVGSVIASLFMAQRSGLPRRPLRVMYIAWAVGMGMTAFFGLVANIPQAMLVSFIAEASIAVLIVIWFTAMQRLVPGERLGRVSSLDWMISLIAMPAGYAAAAPVADFLGMRTTLLVAAALIGTPCLLLNLLPGVRSVQRFPDGTIGVVGERDDAAPLSGAAVSVPPVKVATETPGSPGR